MPVTTSAKRSSATRKHIKGKSGGSKASSDSVTSVRSNKSKKYSSYVSPMLAHLHDQPFDDDNWIFELKWDGYRALADINSSGVKLYSRNGLAFEKLYEPIFTALHSLTDDMLLDGEIVVLNKEGKSDFQKLQQYDMHRTLPLVFYVFDCLRYQGKSLTKLPLLERKKILQKAIPKDHPVIRYSDHIAGSGIAFFRQVMALDIEGMIAKRADSLYYPGKRSKDWLKIKNHNTQEAIIAGYTEPKGSRQYFGALLLAIKENGKLRYIGHTGTGFNNKALKQLYEKLQPLKRMTSPFDQKIPLHGAVTFVEPRLVCAIKFTEITADGILRHPVFMGLRMDKGADETTKIDKTVSKSVKEKIIKRAD